MPFTWPAFCSGSQALAGRGRARASAGPPTSASALGPKARNTLRAGMQEAGL